MFVIGAVIVGTALIGIIVWVILSAKGNISTGQ